MMASCKPGPSTCVPDPRHYPTKRRYGPRARGAAQSWPEGRKPQLPSWLDSGKDSQGCSNCDGLVRVLRVALGLTRATSLPTEHPTLVETRTVSWFVAGGDSEERSAYPARGLHGFRFRRIYGTRACACDVTDAVELCRSRTICSEFPQMTPSASSGKVGDVGTYTRSTAERKMRRECQSCRS